VFATLLNATPSIMSVRVFPAPLETPFPARKQERAAWERPVPKQRTAKPEAPVFLKTEAKGNVSTYVPYTNPPNLRRSRGAKNAALERDIT
jgi:hypothetical protein